MVTQVPVALVSVDYGVVQTYAGVVTGGSGMCAVLGPDMGDNMRRGTPTNSTSLQPLMGMLNTSTTPYSWVAGHLLNADLGGSGTDPRNLTPLTSAANNNHSTFESHVKNLLAHCQTLDNQNRAATFWYGIRYQVGVSTLAFAETRHPNDIHSYVYSHITVGYAVVKIDKATRQVQVATDQGAINDFRLAPRPTFTVGTAYAHRFVGPLHFGPIELHNG